MQNSESVIIYTDGACKGNPGPGGYGAVLMYKEHRKDLSQGFRKTTNNRMELLAVIVALESLKRPCSVKIYSDSKYIVDAINQGWPLRWQSKGWMRNKSEKAKNVDLWQRLLPLLSHHSADFFWVKGHSGDEFNEIADQLAVKGAEDKTSYLIDQAFENDDEKPASLL